jgi:DNA modification methylase
MTTDTDFAPIVPFSKLRPAPWNPRTISDPRFKALVKSLKADPALLKVRPVLADETGEVYAGNMRLRAAEQLGADWRREAYGEDGVPAVLEPISDEAKRARAVRDNVSGGEWHEQELAELIYGLSGKVDLEALAMPPQEVQNLIRTVANSGPEKGNAIPELPEKPDTMAGDLYLLGQHRLLCGDTTVDADVVRLMGDDLAAMVLTDPPYAIYGSSTGVSSDVADDKMVRPFFEALLRVAVERVDWFGHVYVHCDWRSWPALWDSARRVRMLDPKNLLVWDKGGSGLGSNYANTYELIGFFAKIAEGGTMRLSRPTGQRAVLAPNLLRHSRPEGAERMHNAAKPVVLLQDLVRNSSDVSDIVLDLFAGSGSTLIAAHREQRRAYLMEIDPRWCDVIVARYRAAGGGKVTRERDGQTREVGGG